MLRKLPVKRHICKVKPIINSSTTKADRTLDKSSQSLLDSYLLSCRQVQMKRPLGTQFNHVSPHRINKLFPPQVTFSNGEGLCATTM